MPGTQSCRRPWWPVAVALLAGCGGSARDAVGRPESPAAAPISATDGGGDALASAMLLGAGHAPAQSPSPVATIGPDALRVRFHALAHLQVTGLGTGAGASLEGSARIRRLALAPNAPGDRDGDGTTLDEVLDDELARLAAAAGWPSFEGAHPLLFPWRSGTAALRGRLDATDPAAFSSWRTDRGPRAGRIDLEQVGHALFGRALASSGLLLGRRGMEIGATPREGMLGLALLQQALAIEETLLRSLFWDGAGLGSIDPESYDPLLEARVPARRLRVIEAPGQPGVPASYAVDDPASDLAATGVLLRGAAYLAWMADAANPHPELVETFRGMPFTVAVAQPPTQPPAEPNFTEDVAPILQARCTACHGGPLPVAGLSLESFLGLMAGGSSGRTLVVPGDRASSPLWIVINGPWVDGARVVPRMPNGGPPLAPAQIQTIGAWIDAGAPRDPAVLPPPNSVGRGLARVLLRNCVALHSVDVAGHTLLHDRYALTRRGAAQQVVEDPSGLALPRSTGLALSGLAAFVAVPIPEVGAADFLGRVAMGASALLTRSTGEVVRGYDLRSATELTGSATLDEHAALTAGLFAAGRVLDDESIRQRARLLAVSLLVDFATAEFGVFAERPGAGGVRLDPVTASLVLESLLEATADGVVSGAGDALRAFVDRSVLPFVLSEWPGDGEVTEDGIGDTDGDGIPEPALAGGTHGLVPTFRAVLALGAPADPESSPVTWSEHVWPLFREKCSGCHVLGAQLGGLQLDSPKLIRLGGVSGLVALVPGDPRASFLLQKLALRTPVVGLQMPLARTPLSARSIALIEEWIRTGARQR